MKIQGQYHIEKKKTADISTHQFPQKIKYAK